jgi:hypothetical protein
MKSSKQWYVPAIVAGSLLIFVSLIPAQRNESVVIPRLYTGSDGQTHAEGTEARFVTRADGIGQSPLVTASGFFYLKLPAGHVQEWHPHSSREVILTNEAPRRNRSMGVADMGVAGFGGKPASRKVATLARSLILGDDEFPTEARISLGLACPRINRWRPVLVQREVERGRSPLASITPFSASRFGTTSPQRSGGWRNGWRLKLVFKERKTRWVVRAHTARVGGRTNWLGTKIVTARTLILPIK